MPRPVKIEENYEKIEYWTKIFMYSNPEWNNISGIVEIIRNLDRRCIISHKYGKGQNTIKMYSSQYYHLVIGHEIKKQEDYIQNIIRGFVKFIFIFSDSPDPVSTNLMNIAKKYKIIVICYSNIDSIYHFYNYSVDSFPVYRLSSAPDVIRTMKEMSDYTSFKKIVDLFPEFDIIPEVVITEQPVLARCLELLKSTARIESQNKEDKKIKKIDNSKPLFNTDLIKLKRNAYIRKTKATALPDTGGDIVLPVTEKQKMLLSQFFKKK